MEEKEKVKEQQSDSSIAIIIFFAIGIYIACCIYASVMFDYYPNSETTILKHDKFNEKVTAIEIEQGKVESTDFIWNLLFRYKYIKNERENALVRIDKLKQKAVYLIDKDVKYTKNGVKYKIISEGSNKKTKRTSLLDGYEEYMQKQEKLNNTDNDPLGINTIQVGKYKVREIK